MFGKILCFFGRHGKESWQAGAVRHCKRCGWGMYVTFCIRVRYIWFGLFD